MVISFGYFANARIFVHKLRLQNLDQTCSGVESRIKAGDELQ